MQRNSNSSRHAPACSILLSAALVAFVAIGLSGCHDGPMDAATRGRELYQTCAPCHNADGSGNPVIGAPNIAGMKQWYVQAQLQKFRSGTRGVQFNDLEGMRMRPVALSLNNDDDVAAVAKYVESMPVIWQTPSMHGDPHTGDNAFHAVCSACHGQNGEGNPAIKAPRLAGIDDWYLATQLRKFKAGVRGYSPKDLEGRLMRPMARGLATDEAVRNVVAYLDTLKQTGKAPGQVEIR
jgi:cytochrome c oxidase subunit 2